MHKRFIFSILIPAFLLLSGLKNANAGATFTSSAVTCSSFSATGTVTTAFVGIRVWNSTDGQVEGGPALIDSFFNVGAPVAYFPATAGVFSFTVNFPLQDTGDVIVARIYATDSQAFGAWDGLAFPQVTVACAGGSSVIPTLDEWMLAMLALVLGAVGLLAVRRHRRV